MNNQNHHLETSDSKDPLLPSVDAVKDFLISNKVFP